MRFKLTLSALIISALMISCSPKRSTQFDEILLQLEGEWTEAPGIGYREVWQRAGNRMTGAGYMHSGNTFSKTEDLAIIIKDSTLTYHAIVFDQNAGREIDFYLKDFTDTSLVFVNVDHDFPNIIGYYFENDTSMVVKVRSISDTNAGFEFRLKKNRSLFKGSGLMGS